MTIFEMLEQSTLLTVIGMAVVFAFLWIMIICINATAKLVHKMGWDKDAPPETQAPKSTGKKTAEITAAISAAVTEHRKKEGAQHE
jgi:oxaloacetate decarboxylase gamma subunit